MGHQSLHPQGCCKDVCRDDDARRQGQVLRPAVVSWISRVFNVAWQVVAKSIWHMGLYLNDSYA